MLKNVKQFKSSDDVDALKNLAEEFVDLGNVHHQLQEFISEQLVKIMILLKEIIENVVYFIQSSKTKKELYK